MIYYPYSNKDRTAWCCGWYCWLVLDFAYLKNGTTPSPRQYSSSNMFGALPKYVSSIRTLSAFHVIWPNSYQLPIKGGHYEFSFFITALLSYWVLLPSLNRLMCQQNGQASFRGRGRPSWQHLKRQSKRLPMVGATRLLAANEKGSGGRLFNFTPSSGTANSRSYYKGDWRTQRRRCRGSRCEALHSHG